MTSERLREACERLVSKHKLYGIWRLPDEFRDIARALAATEAPAATGTELPEAVLDARVTYSETCPNCGKPWVAASSPSPAPLDAADMRRVAEAITNVAKRHGITKNPPPPLAHIYGYTRTIPEMDAEFAAEYNRLARLSPTPTTPERTAGDWEDYKDHLPAGTNIVESATPEPRREHP